MVRPIDIPQLGTNHQCTEVLLFNIRRRPFAASLTAL
jgi:hypothetical protein